MNQLYTNSALKQLRDKRRAEAVEKQAIEQTEKTSASGGPPSEQTENLSKNPSPAQESSTNPSSPSDASAAQIAQRALDLPSTPRRNPARP
jgi:phage tail tape-measure protein